MDSRQGPLRARAQGCADESELSAQPLPPAREKEIRAIERTVLDYWTRHSIAMIQHGADHDRREYSDPCPCCLRRPALLETNLK